MIDNGNQGEGQGRISIETMTSGTDIQPTNNMNEVHIHAGDMRWYYFHMGANEQRKFVLDNIRPDLT